MRAIGIFEVRPTRDIDVLRYGGQSIPEVEKVIAECCMVEVEEDGLEFDPESVSGEEIRPQEEYDGIRITLEGRLGNAHIHLQIDMGFGDVVTPEPLLIEYPTLIDGESPRLRAYTLESAIAEKIILSLNVSQRRAMYQIRMKNQSMPHGLIWFCFMFNINNLPGEIKTKVPS